MFDFFSRSLKAVISTPIKYLVVGIFLAVIIIAIAVPSLTRKTSTPANKTQQPANHALNNPPSESLDQLNSSTTSPGTIKVVYNLPVNQRAVYITIDDGYYPNEEVLKLMQQYHLPITTFLIEQAAQKHPDFWHRFVSAGGHIENHTADHPSLTHLSPAEQKNEISQPVDYLRQYGSPVDELRPPYGDYNSEVGQVAWESGMKYIVLWNAEMKNATFETRNGGLKPGDIILLHWVPGLDQELLQLLNIIQKQNLGVADLTLALNGKPQIISWLPAPISLSNASVSKPTGTFPNNVNHSTGHSTRNNRRAYSLH